MRGVGAASCSWSVGGFLLLLFEESCISVGVVGTPLRLLSIPFTKDALFWAQNAWQELSRTVLASPSIQSWSFKLIL